MKKRGDCKQEILSVTNFNFLEGSRSLTENLIVKIIGGILE